MMQKSPPLRTAGAFLPKRLNRKPGSVLNDDLSRLHVAMQLQPPPGTRRARIVPIWALLLVGFTEPRKSPSALVRSYRTFPPFPAQNAGSLFLLHYPWGHPRRRMFYSFGHLSIAHILQHLQHRRTNCNFLLKKCHLMGIILCMGIYKYPRLGRGQQEKGKDYV